MSPFSYKICFIASSLKILFVIQFLLTYLSHRYLLKIAVNQPENILLIGEVECKGNYYFVLCKNTLFFKFHLCYLNF